MNSEEVVLQGFALHFLLLGSIISLRVIAMKESPLMIKSKALLDNCTEVKRILISSINTAKENMK